jgi:pimeloyl-ACP methyl ester carboxylesterase
MGASIDVLRALLLIAILFVSGVRPAQAQYRWLTLPPTPTLPAAERSGYAAVNGARIWYAEFGHGNPVILVHGGLANSNYLGLQVRALAPHYRVIVLDSRCHGRSTCGSTPIGYDIMSSDVVALMDVLHVRKAAVVGWSDGAIIGLDLAIHHRDRLTKVFAFAANSDPSGVIFPKNNPVDEAENARLPGEYRALSPTPAHWDAFNTTVVTMWKTQPHFTAAQLRSITTPTWIVDADHDEYIKRSNTDFMAATIPGAGELILPAASHFAFLQDPALFNAAMLNFLQ